MNRTGLGSLVLVVVLGGCGRESSAPVPQAPQTEAELRLRLEARVRIAQSGLESQVDLACVLVRARRGWRVEEIREEISLREGGRSHTRRRRRADFAAADPLEALGLPALLLRLSGFERGSARRGPRLTVQVAGVSVPLRLRRSRRGPTQTTEASGRVAVAGGPFTLSLRSRASYERLVRIDLPRTLDVEVESIAAGGPGRDASSRTSLTLRIEPEPRT